MEHPRPTAVPASARRFARAETGAVTVDWVVLCAAVTGVILFTHDEVRAALRHLSDDVAEELTDSEIVRAGEVNSVEYGFDDGPGRWSGAAVTDIPGLGMALGPIGGSGGLETVSHDFIMAADIDSSTITFDLYALDSLDDEAGVIYLNGREIGRMVSGHNGAYFVAADVPGVSVFGVLVVDNEHLGGFADDSDGGGWDRWGTDDIMTVTIRVDDPGDVLSFGFGSTANQDTDDESFAIDNFRITGVADETGGGAGGGNGNGNGNGNANGHQTGHGQGNDP